MQSNYGITCPSCSNLIQIEIEDLIIRDRIICNVCFLKLEINKAECQDTLDGLKEIHREQKNIRAEEKRNRFLLI
jgi:S-adenosylhomocysteine hydrolase